jgi:voltage-gated potassium channel
MISNASHIVRRLSTIVTVLFVLTAVGIVWFWLIEDWSLIDAAYMTVITLSTVGYQEVRPLQDRDRIFVMLYLVCGLGVFLFAMAQLGEMVIRAELRGWLRKRGMNSKLKSVANHYIVCGYGRMGRALCRHLGERKLPFVVIDEDQDAISDCELHGWTCLLDDATCDRALSEAGIARARGLAVVLSSDADNLYVVLSARLLAPDLQIIARATDESSAEKMEKAGANRVVSLFTTGAATMAQQLINPAVEDFFEFVSKTGTALDFAEIRVTEASPCCRQTLRQTDFRRRGIIVVAIRRADGTILLPAPINTLIEPDDVLIALGEVAAVSQFLSQQELASSPDHA